MASFIGCIIKSIFIDQQGSSKRVTDAVRECRSPYRTVVIPLYKIQLFEGDELYKLSIAFVQIL